MNWSDYFILIVIVILGLVGLARGLILSVFKIASFFISIILAVKLYPKAADILSKTPLYANIKESILNNLMNRYDAALPVSGQEPGGALGLTVDKLALPEFIKKGLIEKIPSPSEIVDIPGILSGISDEITKVIISILSLVLLFILIRIALFVAGFILKGLSKLPVIKQLDRFGGLAFGILEGVLMVYILFAILMLFNSAPQFKPIFDSIDSSIIAKGFYQDNFIITWIFPS